MRIVAVMSVLGRACIPGTCLKLDIIILVEYLCANGPMVALPKLQKWELLTHMRKKTFENEGEIRTTSGVNLECYLWHYND